MHPPIKKQKVIRHEEEETVGSWKRWSSGDVGRAGRNVCVHRARPRGHSYAGMSGDPANAPSATRTPVQGDHARMLHLLRIATTRTHLLIIDRIIRYLQDIIYAYWFARSRPNLDFLMKEQTKGFEGKKGNNGGPTSTLKLRRSEKS